MHPFFVVIYKTAIQGRWWAYRRTFSKREEAEALREAYRRTGEWPRSYIAVIDFG